MDSFMYLADEKEANPLVIKGLASF